MPQRWSQLELWENGRPKGAIAMNMEVLELSYNIDTLIN